MASQFIYYGFISQTLSKQQQYEEKYIKLLLLACLVK